MKPFSVNTTWLEVAVFGACLLILAGPAPAHCLTPEQIEMVERIIYTEFMPHGKVPGMSISIVHDDQVYSAGHGYRNREKGLLATNETLFAVGSLSKMLSAMYITHMLSSKFPELGESVLDVPIRQLAPTFDLVLSDRYRTEHISFRDILSHRVCTLDYTLHLYAISGGVNKSDVIYQRRYAPEYCHFRDIQISYSNIMIGVAGEAAAAVVSDGSSFEEHATAFFRQIGMKHTRFIQDSEDYEKTDNFASPYYFRDGRLNPMNPDLIKQVAPIPAGGGVLTSSNDMAQFIKFVINRGKVDGAQVVEEHVIDWVTRISTPYRFSEYRTSPSEPVSGFLGYGLGMFLNIFDGYQMIGHEGFHAPYTTLVNILPALKIGIFTTASGPGIGPDHYGLQYRLMQSLSSQGIRPAAATLLHEKLIGESDLLAAQDQFMNRGRVPSMGMDAPNPQNIHPLNHSEIIGKYGQVLQGVFEISDVNETTLYFRYGKWGTGYLTQRATTSTIYDLEFDSDLPQVFYANPWFEDLPPIYIDFSAINDGQARLSYDGHDFWFIKDWSLDQAPVIPWDPSSCGPSYV